MITAQEPMACMGHAFSLFHYMLLWPVLPWYISCAIGMLRYLGLQWRYNTFSGHVC